MNEIKNKKRPFVLSIAGFDPSGGAGILADIKTYEANKVCGMGVVSALTFQNDISFESVNWIDTEDIFKQVFVLQKRFHFKIIKIGLIKDLETLNEIIIKSKIQNPKSKIIYDPIVKATAGFVFQNNFEKEKLFSVLKNIFLITPNTDEIKFLTGIENPLEAAKSLSKHCNVFLKGGHNKMENGKNNFAKDYLFTMDGKVFSFRPKQISNFPKHGSGCVISSAIAANLAKENKLPRACLMAKNYTTKFLMSNKDLLGYHKL